MNFENQLIIFFSSIGSLNGFLLAIYFALLAKKKKFSNYFLVLLLLTLSIRIIKSVFFHFNPKLSGVFIQIGISACILIGPFLYLYLKSYFENKESKWILHILPFLLSITILGVVFPYLEYKEIWSKWIIKGIYIQWFGYIILSIYYIKPVLRKKEKLQSIDIWILSVFFGVAFIWLAYIFGSYTSYIIGALSFSFIFYLIALLFIFKYYKDTSFFDNKEKYKNKEIDKKTLELIQKNISIINDKKLYSKPNLTLKEVATELKITPHTLSLFLNKNLNKSFSLFINELRIKKAKELLLIQTTYTNEAIGYESGFKSKSTFYTTFKKINRTNSFRISKIAKQISSTL